MQAGPIDLVGKYLSNETRKRQIIITHLTVYEFLTASLITNDEAPFYSWNFNTAHRSSSWLG